MIGKVRCFLILCENNEEQSHFQIRLQGNLTELAPMPVHRDRRWSYRNTPSPDTDEAYEKERDGGYGGARRVALVYLIQRAA